MKHKIKHQYTDNVLFECEVPDTVASRMATRHALEQATKAGANLVGANLARANLARANLARANLARANLAGAHLDAAILDGANLVGANLDGDIKLIGKRPVFQIGPIGSRCEFFTAYITDKGLRVTAGCFKQKTIEEFREKLATSHQDNDHAKEYEMALLMIECHEELWTPKEEK